MVSQPDVRLRLSTLRALQGAIPRALRAVSVERSGTIIRLRAVFEREPSERERELISIAGAEIASDYHSTEVTDILEEYVVTPPPQPPLHLRELIFLRAEDP